MTGEKLDVDAAPGDIVQLDPSSEIGQEWGPQLCIVTEVKPWGVQAYFLHARARGDYGPAYIRLAHQSFEKVGQAAWWIPGESLDG
jgi:hypothetical protein